MRQLSQTILAPWLTVLAVLAAYNASWLWAYRGQLYGLWMEVMPCLHL